MMFQPVARESEPFNLRAPIAGPDGSPLKECAVRVPTRRELKALVERSADAVSRLEIQAAVLRDFGSPQLTGEEARAIAGDVEDDMLALYVARFGDVRDREFIRASIGSLVVPDVMLITRKAAEFEKELAGSAQPPRRRVILEHGSCSGPFELRSGIVVDDVRHRSAVVRLIPRGDMKEILRAASAKERERLSLLYSLARIGAINPVELEHVDQLADEDIDVINEQIEALMAAHAQGDN